ARRVELWDRRLSSTPRDYLSTRFSTDFASQSPLGLTHLPAGASDIAGYNRQPASWVTRQTADGLVYIVPNRTHGEVVTFEWDENALGQSDVVVWDRRGVITPAAIAL